MNTLQRLFVDLEFAPREHVVTMPVAYVGVQPSASHHSIYEELWHLTKWQTFVLGMVRGEAVRSDYREEAFPDAQAPETEAAWRALVAEFLAGSEEGGCGGARGSLGRRPHRAGLARAARRPQRLSPRQDRPAAAAARHLGSASGFRLWTTNKPRGGDAWWIPLTEPQGSLYRRAGRNTRWAPNQDRTSPL